MEMFRIGEGIFGKLLKRLFHGVKGVFLACEDGIFDKPMKCFRQRIFFCVAHIMVLPGNEKFTYRHPVHGNSAGLVTTEHRRGTQCLHSGNASCEDPFL